MSEMRRKRNSRQLLWPIVAALVVTVILLLFSPLRDQLGFLRYLTFFAEPVSAQPVVANDSLPIRSYRKPKFLSGMRDDLVDWAVDEDFPRERRNDQTMAALNGQLDTASLLTNPADAQPGVTLFAPVRSEREELAGFVNGARSAAGPFRTVSTFTSMRVDRQPGTSQSLLDNEYDTQGLGSQVPSNQELPYGVDAENWQSPVLDEIASDGMSGVGVAWPRTPALVASLQNLEQWQSVDDQGLDHWVARVRQTLQQLQSLPTLTDYRSTPLLQDLDQLAKEGLATGEAIKTNRQQQEAVLRVAHAIGRRVVVWQAICKVADKDLFSTVSLRETRYEPIDALLRDLNTHIETTGDAVGWKNYLLLDDIERLSQDADSEARRLVAQRVLSRVTWEGLSSSQSAWLDHETVHALTERLRPWTDAPLDYVALLNQIERQESDAIDLGSIDVAGAVQVLRFSDHQPTYEVAEAINNYYRNGNLRLAVSVELLRRLLPEVPQRDTVIRQTIVGTPVRGSGIVQSQLGMELIPTPGLWQFQLSTLGDVKANTRSRRGPVNVANRSHSQFTAKTPIVIDRGGIRIGETQVNVNSNVRLQRLQTDFDGFPVIESLVRSIAMAQYEETRGQAKRESECLMQQQVAQSVSDELQQKIQLSSDQLSTRLLGPLGRLQLDPMVVDLNTSDTRLTVRYRVAGDWQLAAFTPRPRAMADSVLSMQVHQSTINNAFEQIVPNGSAKSIRELASELSGLFGAQANFVKDDVPADVRIQFAASRPVTVEIEEGRLWLTLRIVKLQNDNGLNLNHFVVRAAYRPEVDGMSARLVRDGVIEINGPRLGIRERLPIRAIFNKVLDGNDSLPIVGESLATHEVATDLRVSQLDLTDGWLGLSISPKQSGGSLR